MFYRSKQDDFDLDLGNPDIMYRKCANCTCREDQEDESVPTMERQRRPYYHRPRPYYHHRPRPYYYHRPYPYYPYYPYYPPYSPYYPPYYRWDYDEDYD